MLCVQRIAVREQSVPQQVLYVLVIHRAVLGVIRLLGQRITIREQGEPQQVFHVLVVHRFITVQVTNSMGDTAWLDLPVLRLSYDPLRPTIYLTQYLVYVNVGVDFDPSMYVAKVIGNGDAKLEDVKIQDWVDTSVPGTYRVYYTYTDDQGTGMAILTVSVQ